MSQYQTPADRISNLGELKYLALLWELLERGERREYRNGTRIAGFGAQVKYDLRRGFPLFTTKKVHFKSIAVELLWFLRGETNVKFLHDHGVTIWDEWADENGDLGPVYGKQWRSWPDYENPDRSTIDQIANVIRSIKRDPFGTRHIVSAWNPAEVDQMALPPCHTLFQFYVTKDGYLNCQLYQRSADMFLGVPFNVASYALLTHIIAMVTQLKPGTFVHTLGDYHVYGNHVEQVREQLGRTPRGMPKLVITPRSDVDAYTLDDIMIMGYDPHPKISAPVSK